MGCGSSVSQVADISREGAFRPIRLLEANQFESAAMQGKLYLFGETRTERKILECDLKSNSVKKILRRTRIPFPKIHLDPIEALYQQSQQIFHLGMYGFSQQPPFNNMLALFLQSNLIFTCGGRDYDNYNIKNEAFFYSIVEQPFSIATEMIHSSEMTERAFKPKHSRNKFQKMASMNKKRYCHTGIYCSKLKSILVFGGINEKGDIMDSCELYNLFENSWKELPPMNKPRANAHCFQYGNRIFVFGGRSPNQKLSKKIEAFLLDTHEWSIMNFKLHRGIEQALVFSHNPNQILIVGGTTYDGNTRSVLRVDLKKQTYIWDSELNHQYKAIKGVSNGHEIFVFGGDKDICETYFHRKWKRSTFDHRKHADLDDLERFSYTQESLIVKMAEVTTKEEEPLEPEVFFGNDIYPALVFYDKESGKLRKSPVPLCIRLRSNMGIVQYEKGMYMLIGGSDRALTKCSRSCFFYDRIKNKGSLAIKMNQRRCEFASIGCGNFVYVFGGYDCEQHSALTSCERYDLNLDRWQEIKSMKYPRLNASAVMIGSDKIAIVGGKGQNLLGELEIYYPKSDEYQLFRPRFQIRGEIMAVYSRQQDEECTYILRKDEDQSYYECKIDLGAHRQQSESDPLPAIVEPRLQSISLNDPTIEMPIQATNRIEVKPLIKNEQDLEESEESRQMHKIGLPKDSLEVRMIEVKSKKRYIDEKASGVVEQEEYEQEIEIQRVDLKESIIEEIRKSGKYLIEELIREKSMGKLQEERQSVFEDELERQKPEREPSKVSEIKQKLKEKSLDNQFKGSDRPLSSVIDQQDDDGVSLSWLRGKYSIIKRNNTCYCVGATTILAFEYGTDQHEEKLISGAQQIRLQSLS